MKQLNQNILNWAEEKGIIAKSNASKQLCKTMEEFIETVTAIALLNDTMKSDHSDDYQVEGLTVNVKDGIGDIYVTLVIHAFLSGCSFPDTLDENDAPENKEVQPNINAVGELVLRLANRSESWIYTDLTFCLLDLAEEYGLTLQECVQHSYDIISKRTGEMIDGIFVKDK